MDDFGFLILRKVRRMGKIQIVLVLLFIWATSAMASEDYIKPEVTTTVRMSNTDVNRIQCRTGPINDIILSKEKGVTVKIVGSNVFVKFLVKVTNGKQTYVKTPTEFHVVCNGDIYTLVALPHAGIPETIRLGSHAKREINANIARFKGMAKEEIMVKLTRDILKDDTEDYDVKKDVSPTKTFKSVYYQKNKDVIVDGVGLIASEYTITPKINMPYINEKYFIDSQFGSSIDAITLLPQPLKKGQPSRLIVIQRKYQ